MKTLQQSTENQALVQKRENYLINTRLDAQQQKFVKIFETPTVGNVDNPSLKKMIDSALASACQDVGKELEKEDFKYMVNELFDLLRDRYQGMRLVEIKKAFQLGVAKEYGDWYGINAVTFKIFIQKYMTDQTRLEAMQKYMEMKKSAETKPEPTEEEKQSIIKNNIIKAFQTFKKNAWYNDINNIVFAELHKHEMLHFTDEQLIDFYRTAKKRLIDQYSASTVGLNFIDKRDALNSIKRLQGIKGISMTNDTEIIAEANRVALNHFFKTLEIAGSEIEELLEFVY